MNRKGASFTEVLFIIVMFCFLVLPWPFFGLWWWFWFFLSIASIFSIFEALAHFVGKNTLSRMFWKWSTKEVDGKKPNIWKAYFILGSLFIGWLMLLIHLGWKLWT